MNTVYKSKVNEEFLDELVEKKLSDVIYAFAHLLTKGQKDNPEPTSIVLSCKIGVDGIDHPIYYSLEVGSSPMNDDSCDIPTPTTKQ